MNRFLLAASPRTPWDTYLFCHGDEVRMYGSAGTHIVKRVFGTAGYTSDMIRTRCGIERDARYVEHSPTDKGIATCGNCRAVTA